jgi:hypothetical protein
MLLPHVTASSNHYTRFRQRLRAKSGKCIRNRSGWQLVFDFARDELFIERLRKALKGRNSITRRAALETPPKRTTSPERAA